MTSPAFSFYPKDWLTATLTWSLEARGAYMTLLAYQWDAGCVPAGMDQLARLLAVSEPRARKLWAIIGDKFTLTGGVWRNERLELERVKQRAYRARQAAAGKQGAAGRWGSPSPPDGDPIAVAIENPWPRDGSSSSSSFSEIPPNPPAGGVRVRREHRDQAKAILKSRLGYCQHEPTCANEVTCHERIALELAQKASVA